MRRTKGFFRPTLVLPGLIAASLALVIAGAVGNRAGTSNASDVPSATFAVSAPAPAQALNTPFQVPVSLAAFTPGGTSTAWGGYDMELAYDRAVLVANDDTRGMCSAAGWGLVETTPHVVTGCAFQSSTATGVLETVTFQCLTNGTSALTLLPRNDPNLDQLGTALFDDNGGVDFDMTLNNSSVTCGSAATPTFTSTATNTNTPTSTNTPLPTNTPTPTRTPTNTPTSTNTAVGTPAPTNTPTPTRTPINGPISLRGEWAPFTRCPIDDPAMLAVDGAASISYCVAAGSESGSIKLGRSTSTTGPSNMQFGLAGSPFVVVAPSGGVIEAAPVDVSGGLLGLACPNPAIIVICNLITNDDLNRVTATVEGAGPATDFDLNAGLALGQPILTLPIKVHLENPLLGATCYIGSDADPIVLRPQNTDLSHSTISISHFDPDGTLDPTGPLTLLKTSGATQGDTTFAVPAASGCGTGSLLDTAINTKEGLPSAAGNNYIILENGSTALVGLANPGQFYPNAGQVLSDYWHSAVCGSVCAPATPTATVTASPTPTYTPTALPTVVGCSGGDTDCDGCPDTGEPQLNPPTNPADPWDFYSVPVPALFAAPNAAVVFRDSSVTATDAQAVFAYFKQNARTGSTEYEQDLNGNGTKDGVEYDRTVAGPGHSGAPDGVITAQDAQLAFAQFKMNYHC